LCSNACAKTVSTHVLVHPFSIIIIPFLYKLGVSVMMNLSFTREEKLFVLAEMIKASRIDVESLVDFIKYHRIEPDWMSMQIPLGRNMNQCMQFAGHISITTPYLKRRPSSVDFEPPTKRPAFSELPEHARPTSSQGILQPVWQPPTPTTAAGPRSANGLVDSSPQTSAPGPAPKKRGRPSRADKAKRDLRPLLPQHLAPRPSPGPVLLHPFSPTTPRPILPALGSPRDIRRGPLDPPSWSPPSMYRVSPEGEEKVPDKAREQTMDTEAARPVSSHLGSPSRVHQTVHHNHQHFPSESMGRAFDKPSSPTSSAYPRSGSLSQARNPPMASSTPSRRESTMTRDSPMMGKSPMSVVSSIGREVPLSNPA
jgi:hypothetical protein